MRAVRAFAGVALLLVGLTLLLIGGGIWAGQHLRDGQASGGEHAVLVLPAWVASTSGVLLGAGLVLAMAAVSLVRPRREVIYLVSAEHLSELSTRLRLADAVGDAAQDVLGEIGSGSERPRARRPERAHRSANGRARAPGSGLVWPPPQPQRNTAVPVSAPPTRLAPVSPAPGGTRVLTMG